MFSWSKKVSYIENVFRKALLYEEKGQGIKKKKTIQITLLFLFCAWTTGFKYLDSSKADSAFNPSKVKKFSSVQFTMSGTVRQDV